MTKTIKSTSLNQSTVFIFGIILICTIYSNAILDFTLLPRFFSLSIFSLLYFVYLTFGAKQKIHIHIIHVFSLAYFSFPLFSSFWAINFSLAITEGSKSLLYFFFILFCTNILRANSSETFEKLIKMSIFLFYISLIFFISQAAQIENFLKTALYELKGLSGHKNLFSIFVFICSVFSCLGVLEFKKEWKTISIITIVIQLLLLAFTQTRSVWMGLIVFILSAVTILLSKKIVSQLSVKKTIGLSLFVILVFNIFFLVLLPKMIDYHKINLQSNPLIEGITDPSSLNERVLVWDKTYSFFNDHKLLGVGANNWQIFFPSTSLPESYVIRDLNVTFQRPHNDFLWILSEYGILGFNLFLLLIITVCCFLYKEIITNFSYRLTIILAGLIGFLCISFFDFPKERVELNLMFYLLLSLGIHFSKISNLKILNEEIKPSLLLKSGIVLLLSFLLIIASLNLKGEYNTKKMYVQQKLGRGNEIIRFSEKASSFCYKMDPITFPLKWYSGTAYAQREDYKNAMLDFKKAFKLHPFNYNLLNDMGSVNYVNGKIDSAIYYYSKSMKINPRYDEPKLNLISIYINEENYNEAAKIDKTIFHDSERRDYYRTLINKNIVHD